MSVIHQATTENLVLKQCELQSIEELSQKLLEKRK